MYFLSLTQPLQLSMILCFKLKAWLFRLQICVVQTTICNIKLAPKWHLWDIDRTMDPKIRQGEEPRHQSGLVTKQSKEKGVSRFIVSAPCQSQGCQMSKYPTGHLAFHFKCQSYWPLLIISNGIFKQNDSIFCIFTECKTLVQSSLPFCSLTLTGLH